MPQNWQIVGALTLKRHFLNFREINFNANWDSSPHKSEGRYSISSIKCFLNMAEGVHSISWVINKNVLFPPNEIINALEYFFPRDLIWLIKPIFSQVISC